MLFHHKDYTQKAIRAGLSPALPAECYLSLPGCLHHTAAAGFLNTNGISARLFRRPEFLVDPPGVEPAHPQHRFCLPIGCSGFPPSVYTHLISELSAYCVGLRQARAFTSPKFFLAASSQPRRGRSRTRTDNLRAETPGALPIELSRHNIYTLLT